MRMPRYYADFKCIADKCTHSCCVGWEIDVDEQTLGRYEQLSGEIGETICKSIEKEGESAHFRLGEEDRCPHLKENGLCRIICALGEEYLCEICREHPRFYNLVDGEWEVGLGASCEEAARLILSAEDYFIDREEALLVTKCAQNTDTYSIFDAKTWRFDLFCVLCDRTRTYEERIAQITRAYGVPVARSCEEHLALLGSLEYLDASHRALFEGAYACEMPQGEHALLCERFLAYLVYRHASPAESEADFRLGVGLALLITEIFAALIGGEKGLLPVQAARILSEELEYSEENTDAIRGFLTRAID